MQKSLFYAWIAVAGLTHCLGEQVVKYNTNLYKRFLIIYFRRIVSWEFCLV